MQRTLELPAFSRGFHPITAAVVASLPELREIDCGLLHLFLLHTSAGLTINENADPDVPVDLATSFDRIAPEAARYRHTCEGPDDMPAHVKASLTGVELTIPVAAGRLVLGTWQGIHLAEFRNRGGRRRIVLTLQGRGRETTPESGTT